MLRSIVSRRHAAVLVLVVIASLVGALPSARANGEVFITFSEYPVGTQLDDQYRDVGVLFGGDDPYIANDGAQPDSPVASGSPQYHGAIQVRFVSPEGNSTQAEDISLRLGYLNDYHSVEVQWRDSWDGNVLGSWTNPSLGVIDLAIPDPTAELYIQIVGTEGAGYTLDNLRFTIPGQGPGDAYPPATDDCGQVTFIGVAGSGEPAYAGAPDLGMGARVHNLYTQLRDEYDGALDIRGHGVVYPAASTSKLFPGGEDYFESIRKGENALRHEIADRAEECPDAPVLLSGYSQGALVIRNVIDTPGVATPFMSQVAGVALLADPRFDGDDTARGTFNWNDYGVENARRAVAGGSTDWVPAAWDDRVRSLCYASDLVCGGIPGWTSVHTGRYASYQDLLPMVGFLRMRLDEVDVYKRGAENLAPDLRVNVDDPGGDHWWVSFAPSIDPDGDVSRFQYGDQDSSLVTRLIPKSQTHLRLRVTDDDGGHATGNVSLPDLARSGAAATRPFSLRVWYDRETGQAHSFVTDGKDFERQLAAEGDPVPYEAYAVRLDGHVLAIGGAGDPELIFEVPEALDPEGVWDVVGFTGEAISPPTAGEVEVRAVSPLQRLAGTDRVGTAIALSRAAFPAGASSAVLASSVQFADALGAAPLAAARNGPVLLTAPGSLDDRVLTELDRLGLDAVTIVGGSAAVGPEVVAALEDAGLTVERLGGADRFETAALIADQLPSPDRIVVEGAHADPGRGWPDAVSASQLAAAKQVPILLATAGSLPPATAAALDGAGHATIVGGSAAISGAVFDEVAALADGASRLAGPDRYATSRAVAAALVEDHPRSLLTVVTGRNWPDALAAGPATAAAGGVMLLCDGGVVDACTSWAQDHGATSGWLAGGTAALPDAVEEAVGAALRQP